MVKIVNISTMISKQINRSFTLICVALTLSAFTHLWNPVGFPDLFYDEGVYMRRAMHVLSGLGPQEAYFHDHPFFGQLFLAGALALIGYPNSLHPIPDAHSIEILYLVPRIMMGVLAVLDTFLIYKIAERRYGRNVALIASILFAVMPMTWLLRRILLDSILLPFLLSSIFLAVYSKDSKNKMILTFFSGGLLGLSIFTKETMFTMIPLVAYLIYTNNGRNTKALGLWFIPVVLIPLIWPAQSISAGQFDLWLKDVLWQAQRQGQFDQQFAGIIAFFLKADPVLFALGAAGFVLAAIKRNFFPLLWVIPFLIFLSIVGYAQYFYWIVILPAFCIASAVVIEGVTQRIRMKKTQVLQLVTVTGIGIFGLVSTTMLIITNISGQYEATAFVVQYVQNDDRITVVSSPVYSWMFSYIYGEKHVLSDYRDLLFYPLQTEKVILVADPHFIYNLGAGVQLQKVYNNTSTIATFKGNVINYDINLYPYTSMRSTYEGGVIEIRISK